MRNWRDFLRGPERQAASHRTAPPAPTMPSGRPPPPRVTGQMIDDVRAMLRRSGAFERHPVDNPFQLPKYPPGVIGHDTKLAMDDASSTVQVGDTLAWARQQHGLFAEGIGFYGYPYLAELNQRPEYRRPSEVIAEEMTRKWFKLVSTGDKDQTDKIKILNDKIKHFKLREIFYEALLYDGQYGQSFVFPDVGDRQDDAEMQAPLILDRAKIPRGSLKRFAVIDPMWMAPIDYNSTDPTDPTFYKPQTWFVMGRRFSASRLMQFNSRPLADILKPAYNFGGLSLTQMLKPYVDNWLRTRQSVSDLLNSFTVWILETNLASTLAPKLQSGGGATADDLINRLELFALVKNVRGVAAIDKNNEAMTNVSAPLGTLDHLQAQAQEHQCLTGDTLILTDRGHIRIDKVTIADKVMTRAGWAPLIFAGVTGHASHLIEIETANSTIRATESHPIWVPQISEFVAAKNVRPGDRLLADPTWPAYCTTRFGAPIADQFQKVSSSIMRTVIKLTTGSTICNWSTGATTANSTWSAVGLGSIDIPAFAGSDARFARPFSLPLCESRRPRSTAAVLAKQRLFEVVSARRIRASEPVYNLEVAPGHRAEFFSNGVLTHNSAVTGIPLVKQFGITPSGLNSSTDGEVRVFYDSITARQHRVCGPHLKRALDIIQIDEFGEIDPGIGVEWLPLWELDAAGRAATRKTDADTAAVYIESGVIDADEERRRVANAEDSLYPGLEGPAPGVPERPEGEGLENLSDPAGSIARRGMEGSTGGANEGDSKAASDETPDDLPALLRGRVAVHHVDFLPDREREAGYFQPRSGDRWGEGDGSGSITLASRIRLSAGNERTIAHPDRVRTHEIGHAMDHALGGPSSDLEPFLASATSRGSPAERIGTAYYFADPREAFAEGYAALNCPDDDALYFGGLTRGRARELFGDILSRVRGATDGLH